MKINSFEVGLAQIKSAKVLISEVNPRIGILSTPLIPGRDAVLELGEVFRFGHATSQ